MSEAIHLDGFCFSNMQGSPVHFNPEHGCDQESNRYKGPVACLIPDSRHYWLFRLSKVILSPCFFNIWLFCCLLLKS